MLPCAVQHNLGNKVDDKPLESKSSPPPSRPTEMAEQRPTRRPDVSVRVVEGETVILDRQGGLIHQLNPTASYIWERCDGRSTLEDIAQQLIEAFDVDAATVRDDIATIVGEFRRLNLLV